MNYWDQIRHYLQSKVSADGYDNWLKATAFVGQNGDTLYVSVPDRETRAWLESEYTQLIQGGIQALGLPVRHVSFEAEQSRPAAPAAPVAVNGTAEPDTAATVLNPKFTFNSFVVGACNQFAHAAAKSVATNPSRSYNPLFLYDGVGMGKTHLMHAIGRELMDKHASMRIIYTSSERFMNEMISCIRTDRMQHFHLGLPLIAAVLNTLILVVTILIRRPPKRITPNPWYWLLAFVASYWLVFIIFFLQRGRPVAANWITDSFAALGLAIVLWARLSLGRNIGFVPAQRELVDTGAYAFMRHPVYTGVLVAQTAFVLRAYSPLNLLLLAMGVLWFIPIKSLVEEDFLRTDPRYAAYMQRVRARWIPFVI